MPAVLAADAEPFTQLANVVVLSGHGMLLVPRTLDRARGVSRNADELPFELTFTLPADCTVTLWCRTQVFADENLPTHPRSPQLDRFTLDDDIGVMVEEGRFEAARAAVAPPDPSVARTLPLTFAAGEVLPNLLLIPPRRNQLGVPAPGLLLHRVFHGGSTLADRIRLLHGPGRTTHFHWAACSELVIPPHIGMEAWDGAPGNVFELAQRIYRRQPGPALPTRN